MGGKRKKREKVMPNQSAATTPDRLIVGISGASGVLYGIRALALLRDTNIQTHLVMSKAAEMTIRYETDTTAQAVKRLATQTYPIGDIGASISSGSFKTMGMVIAPCSIRTMSEIGCALCAQSASCYVPGLSNAPWCSLVTTCPV